MTEKLILTFIYLSLLFKYRHNYWFEDGSQITYSYSIELHIFLESKKVKKNYVNITMFVKMFFNLKFLIKRRFENGYWANFQLLYFRFKRMETYVFRSFIFS